VNDDTPPDLAARINSLHPGNRVSGRLTSGNRQALQVPDLSIAMKGASPG
jgi:hypothetical protein